MALRGLDEIMLVVQRAVVIYEKQRRNGDCCHRAWFLSWSLFSLPFCSGVFN